jgi:hypothetical protein
MPTIKQFLLTFVAACFLAAFASGALAEDPQAKAKEAMKLLKEKLAAYGAPHVEGKNLFFGEHKINEDVAAVDAVKEALGVNATVFMKQEAKFIRVSTNVIHNGERALGTELDPKGPVYPLVSKGNSYYGKADILGKPYETGYEPILNANKQVIGVYFVGSPIAQ